jgi:hypothetical protein
VTAGAGAEHDGCIDDVARSGDAADLTSSAGASVVKGLDVDGSGGEQAHEPRLAATVAPDLTHDTCGCCQATRR